jgi:hypothetical protein
MEASIGVDDDALVSVADAGVAAGEGRISFQVNEQVAAPPPVPP